MSHSVCGMGGGGEEEGELGRHHENSVKRKKVWKRKKLRPFEHDVY